MVEDGDAVSEAVEEVLGLELTDAVVVVEAEQEAQTASAVSVHSEAAVQGQVVQVVHVVEPAVRLNLPTAHDVHTAEVDAEPTLL